MTYDSQTHSFKGSPLDSSFPTREELEKDRYGKLVLRMCNAMELKLIGFKNLDGTVVFIVESWAGRVVQDSNLKNLYGCLVLVEEFNNDTPGIFKHPREVIKRNPFFMKSVEEVEMLLDLRNA